MSEKIQGQHRNNIRTPEPIAGGEIKARLSADGAQAPAPVQRKERIEFVDILRGFALLGVLIMNFGSFSGQPRLLSHYASGLDRAVILAGDFLVQAKFYSFFSLLFGWGMAVQMIRAQGRGVRFLPVFLRRLFILLGFGLTHGILIWTGDILTAYALFGFFLLLFRNRSPRAILWAAGILLLLPIVIQLPGEVMETVRTAYADATAFLRRETYPESLYITGTYVEITRRRFQEFIGANSWLIYFFGNVFAMFLIGLYVGKRRLLEDVRQYLPLIRRVFWAGILLGLPLNGVFALTTQWASTGWPPWIPPEYYSVFRVGVRTLGAPMLTLAYASGLILLVQIPRAYTRLAPLGHVGRLSLSNYLLQSVVGTLLFYNYGLGLYDQIGPAFGLVLTVIIFAIQIRLSEWWLERFQFGPAEYLWRTLTYGRWQPLRVNETYETRSRNRLVAHLRQIQPIRALIAVWAALLLWAAALAYGYLRLDSAGSTAPSGTPSLAPPELELLIPAETSVSDGLPQAPEPVLSPAVQAVPYNPGPVAASGDLTALARTFDPGTALGFIEALTGPPYDGRYTGSPGGLAAGDYLARQFAGYGLQPAGDAGTFFQAFPIEYARLAATPKLMVEAPGSSPSQPYVFHRDFSAVVGAYSGAGLAEGEVVWVNNCSREDFRSLDLFGKIALCRGAPDVTSNLSASRSALEHGAAGLLLLADPAVHSLDAGSTFGQPWVPDPIPVFWISPAVADTFLNGMGQSAADLTTLFTPQLLEGRVRLEIDTTGDETCPADGCLGRNVLGVLPGRDPAYADEVVILSAHYDHLGSAPNGMTWQGANGSASGVAVLLEIARSWHEQGYVPRRTVLFAAWDAAEMGSLGSRHFVSHPRFPLDQIVGLIELQNAGAGGVLKVGGDETLLPILEDIALGLNEPAQKAAELEGDYTPFAAAGIPAGYLAWSTETGKPHTKGRLSDTLEIIRPEKIEKIGQITDLALLGLVEGEPQIEAMLAARAGAIQAGDRAAFVRSSAVARRSADEIWFNDVQRYAPTGFTYDVSGLHLTPNGARARVRMSMTYPDTSPQDAQGQSDGATEKTYTTSLWVRFALEQGAWKWAGAELSWGEQEEQTGFRIAVPMGEPRLPGLGPAAAAEYARAAVLLGLPENPMVSVLLYPDVRTLAADTALSLPSGTSLWVGPDSIKLMYASQITESLILKEGLVQMMLAQAGVLEDTAPWLWQGLPEVIAGWDDPEGVQMAHTLSLRTTLFGEAAGEAGVEGWTEASSWAATDYLQRRLGWAGLGRFILELGRACRGGLCNSETGINQAMLLAVGIDEPAFQTAWRESWQSRFLEAQESLDAVLQARSEAVLRGDRNRFLSQVDPSVPYLLAEQRLWFEDLERYPAESFELTGTPVAFTADGGILARVSMTYSLADVGARWGAGSVPMLIAFTPGGAGLQWAGPPFETITGEGIEVYFPRGSQDLAGEILAEAQALSAAISSDLEIEEAGSLAIKLYPDDSSLRGSISFSYRQNAWSEGWMEKAGPVKLALQNGGEAAALRPALATRLIRKLLSQTGIDSEWLLKGVSVYESARLNLRQNEQIAAGYLPRLRQDAEQGQVYLLAEMPLDSEVEEKDWLKATSQSWDSVRLLADLYGEATLIDLLRRAGAGATIEDALRQSTGLSLGAFEAAWRESLSKAHIQPAWLETAGKFDTERALQHLATLTRPGWLGRQAGSSGAESAAAYIARAFAAYGLVPLDETSLLRNPDAYFQRFPIQYATLLQTPRLGLTLPDSGERQSFGYRADFVTALPELPFDGFAEGALVWVRDPDYTGMDLAGKIAIRKLELDIQEEMLNAMEHGAAGLILIGSQERQKDILAKRAMPIEFHQGESIPVLVLTEPGYVHLLSQIGQTPAGMLDTPPALPLDAFVSMEISMTEPITVPVANVLGFLPGSDPTLRREVIVLGAHYDHVGDDPPGWLCANSASGQSEDFSQKDCQPLPGLAYSGANDNASGIALLLEIARTWHEHGYRPKRSVLFAAWAAQEPGEAGSSYYLENPAMPLEDTIASIQLDAIGGGNGFRLLGRGFWETEGRLLFSLETAEDLLDGRLKLTPAEGGSDDQPFRTAGISTVLLSWAEASEDNWPDLIADQVDPRKLEISGQMVMLVVMSIAQ